METNQKVFKPAVWFLAIRCGTGVDFFTERLCKSLQDLGYRAEITWLPSKAEYLPWCVEVPSPPVWANIVHINTWLHKRFIPNNLAVLATMHLCVHDAAFEPYKSFFQSIYHRFWVKRLERQVLLKASKVVAVSKYAAERTMAAFGVSSIDVIYNGIDILDDVDRAAERQPHAPVRLLYVGNWSLRKGTNLLGPILEELGDDFELSYTDDAAGLNAGVGLPPNCKSLGRLNQRQLRLAYKNSDILLFPSRLEGFGLSVIEAMSHGLVVVAASSSSLPEIIQNGQNGMLCKPDDVMEFASIIRELAGNDVEMRRLGAAAFKTVVDNFSEAQVVNSYLNSYREILLSH